MSYYQEIWLDMSDKIANFDGTEEHFKELEDDLRALRYKIGLLKAAKLFLNIAHCKGNDKYIEACRKRDKQILVELEKVCFENMDDPNAIRSYAHKHQDEYSVDLCYYLYLAAVNVKNKAYVKDYIQNQAIHYSSFYDYETIEEFLSDCQCNWEGDLEEYIWHLIQKNNESVFKIIQEALDKKLQKFNRNKNEFLKIQKFAAYNKNAYNTDKRNKDKSTIEECLLKIAQKRKKMTFIKFHNESKEIFIKELEAKLSTLGAEISDVKKYVAQENSRFSTDLEDLAFRVATRLGNKDYINAVAPSLGLHIEQRYLRYLEETVDSDIRNLISEYGLWVKNHLSECDLVVQFYNQYDQEIIYFDKKILKEAYTECKDKGLDTDYFISLMELERHANGRVKFNNWEPADALDVMDALEYANQEMYFEGHYTWGPFFEWQWEQDVHADADQKIGWLYILKKPYRHGWNN